MEPTVHRTPLPESEAVLKSMVVAAWLRGARRWAAIVLLAFYGTARVGEVLRCRRRQLVLPDDTMASTEAVFLSLEASKTATRGRPKVQRIRVDDRTACSLIGLAFGELRPEELLFPMSPAAFRSRWDKCLASFGVGKAFNLTPGGLRGGGAVAAYRAGMPVADIQWRMRLKHISTLEYYLQEVAALTALNGLTSDSKLRVKSAVQFFPFLSSSSS